MGLIILFCSVFFLESLVSSQPLTIAASSGDAVIGQNTIWADIRADCSGDGSKSNPYFNLTAAVDAAASRDFIIVQSGFYPERLVISKPQTITASGGPAVIGRGQYGGPRIIGQGQPLLAMTLNVRIPKEEDGETNNWANRLPRILRMLKVHEAGQGPHIVGMQELRTETWKDLDRDLTNYRSFRKDRGDGELLAVFYRLDRLKLLEHGNFFLGINERRSRGDCDDGKPDDNSRVVVWGRFHDKLANKTFYVYNTHFPSENSCERRGSALIMTEGIASRTHVKDPVIAMGDFNDGQEPNGCLNTSFAMLLENTGLVNSYRESRVFHETEKFSTSNGGYSNLRKEQMIDFVLVSPSLEIYNANIDRTMFTRSGDLVSCYQINSQGRCTNTGDIASDLLMYSDHWAVWAVVGFR